MIIHDLFAAGKCLPPEVSPKKEREKRKFCEKMSSADCKMENERKKERMNLLRQGKSFEDREKDCDLDKQRKKTKNDMKNEIEKEFEKISLKHEKRKARDQRNGREKLQQNLKSKKGMRVFREEGRLKKKSVSMKR